MNPSLINHQTIGSGDREPKLFTLNVLPHVYEEIVRGRRIIDALNRKVQGIEVGDQVRLREWTIVLDRPTCYHHVGGFTKREGTGRVISILPSRHKGYTTFILRLVNENSLYARFKAFLSRTLRSPTLSCRGR